MQPQLATYADYALPDQQRMSLARRYFAWQAQTAMPYVGRRIIEAGCGIGNFTNTLGDREMVVGLDALEECVEQVRARFRDRPHFQFRCLDLQDPAFCDLKALRADTIVCMNVLEHVYDDQLALRHMHRVLVPGGRAIFLLPAFAALHGSLDRHMGHHRRYRKGPWRRLAESCGFRVVQARHFNFAGFFGWWFNARVLRMDALSAIQIRWFDRLAVPIQSRLERVLEPPVAQSIFTVIEKPAI